MQPIVRSRPAFILVNGRYVCNNKAREVFIPSGAKGDSLAKFPRRIGAISHHHWS